MIRARLALIAASAAAALFPAFAPADQWNPDSSIRTSPARVEFGQVTAAGARPSATIAWVTANPVKAKGTGCMIGSTSADRKLGVRADMISSGVAKAAWMRVRFRLLRSADSGVSWTEIAGGGLGTWEAWYAANKHPYLTKVFTGLGTSVIYRSDVDFQWADSKKSVIRSQTIKSPNCSQPDLRPDLYIASLTAVDASASSLRWSVTVRNSGKGRSATGRVSLLIGTTRYPSGNGALVGAIDEVGTKRTGTRSDPLVMQRVITVTTPKCQAGSTVLAQFTPDNVADDSSAANDIFPTLVDCTRATPSG